MSGAAPTVSVVIPALNEASRLPLVLGGLPPVDEVIVVDGGSADRTVAAARRARPGVVVVRQTRTGKGNALVCGFHAATGDIVVTLNGDGSADPAELPHFVDALLAGADAAHGSRFRAGGHDYAGTVVDRVGNRLFAAGVNAFFGTRFTDLGGGYHAFWRSALPRLELPAPDLPGLRRGRTVPGDGPEIEPLLTLRAAAQGLRVVEVASAGYPPIDGGRHSRVRRGTRAARTAVREYTRRWRAGTRESAGASGPEPVLPPAAGDGPVTGGRHAAAGGRHSAEARPDAVPPRVRREGGRSRDEEVPRPGAAATRREPGGSRRRHDPTGRHQAGPPELRVITGEGGDDGIPRRRGGHLRAVPGERFPR